MLFLYATGLLLVHLAVLLAPAAPIAQVCSEALTLALIALAGLLRSSGSRKGWCFFLVMLLAFLNASVRLGLLLENRLAPELDGAEMEITGFVASLPVLAGETLRFELGDLGAASGSARLPTRIQVSWFRSARRPAPGERWQLRVRLRLPRGALNPGGPDIDGWFLRKGIGALASVVAHEARHVPGAGLAYPLLRLRAEVASRVASMMRDTSVVGLVTGLAVGIRSGISASQWEVLKATGTGHLFAISGLHVGLVAGLVYCLAVRGWGLSRRLSGQIPPVDAARLLGLMAAAFYAALAGFALPTQRALLMLALLVIARAARRPLSGARLLLLAFLLLVALDPLGMLSAGFWLSFLAVATLVLAISAPIANPLALLLRTQLIVFVGLVPVGLAAFSQVPLVAPLANLFMIPLFSFCVVPLVLAGVLLMAPLPWVAAALLQLAAVVLQTTWELLTWLALHASIWRPHLSGAQWCVLAGACIAMLLPRWPGKSALLAAAALLVIAVPAGNSAKGSYRVVAFDVGHALSVLVSTSNHTLVYDLGKGRGEHGSFRRVLQPYAAASGLPRPDLLVLSHDDGLHLGDVPAFMRAFPGVGLLSGAPGAVRQRFPGTRPAPCIKGLSWRWDGVLFEILQPASEILWEDDDSSCVLRVTGGKMVTLITGDLTSRGEAVLLARYPQLRADLVVGLAHGSKSSSSPLLVRQLGAALAVVSTAASNPWGLPSDKVLARWRASGTRVMVTGTEGSITVDVGPGLAVSNARHGRAWHQ